MVKSFTMYGSPMVSSTPGGMEIGVRPSFDGLEVDAENCRRAAGAGAQFWKAGTRKEGNVTMDEGAMALALLGASIGEVATGCGRGRLHRASVAIRRGGMAIMELRHRVENCGRGYVSRQGPPLNRDVGCSISLSRQAIYKYHRTNLSLTSLAHRSGVDSTLDGQLAIKLPSKM